MSTGLGALVAAMVNGAQALWPGLTEDQFGEVFLHVTSTNTGRKLSIMDMNNLLMAELTRRYGEPRRISGSAW